MVNGLAVTSNNLLQRMPLLKQSLWYAPAKTHLLLWHHFPKTPLGALSVVVCAILSSLFLNEKLSFFGWLGCGLCIVRVNAWLFSSYYIHNAFHYSLGPLSSHLMVWTVFSFQTSFRQQTICRAPRSLSWPNSRISKTLSICWFPRICRNTNREFPRYHLLLCAQVSVVVVSIHIH